MTFMTPQSNVVLPSMANSLQIAGELNIVGELQPRKASCEEPEEPSSALTQTADGMPDLELPSVARSVYASEENADGSGRRQSPDVGPEAGRFPVPQQSDAHRDSRLFSVALLSAFGVATFGWLWLLFQVGRWLLDF
jgi:hypothetical protein